MQVVELQAGKWSPLAQGVLRRGDVPLIFTPATGTVKVLYTGPMMAKEKKWCFQKWEMVQEQVLVDVCDGDGDSYRFGYQGQEKDNELKGIGNSFNYTYRMHDPRIGRFFAIDPLASKYPYYSPFAFSGNRVIDAVELEGLEPASRGNVGVFMGLKTSGMTDKDAQKIVNGMARAEQRAIAPMVEGTLDATPIDDIYGVVFGKHLLNKEEYNRGESAAWTAVTFVPFGKIVKTGGKFILNGFVKTELKWGGKIFKDAGEFRDAVKHAPDRVNAYESAGEQVAEKNGWKPNSSLSKKNRHRDIYTNKKGEHFSVDTETGSFETYNKKGKHQGEINFEGERIDPKDKGTKHDLKMK